MDRRDFLKFAGLDLEKRLLYIQAAQYWLRPALGAVTFALDFFSAPFFQFYFTSNEPPLSLFNKPFLLREPEHQRFAMDKKGYYQQVCNLDERPGYSGVPNPLYRDPKTLLLLGDAKASLRQMIAALHCA